VTAPPDSPETHSHRSRWSSVVLALAGVYNLGWAAWAILSPETSFPYSGLARAGEPLNYPQLWQGLGMVIGVFGVGYLLAATDPVRHWGIVAVGLLSKVLAGGGTLAAVAAGQNPPAALVPSLCNDLVWWVPFGLVLLHVRRISRGKA
jgi:small multidrug resistance pump